MKNEFSFLIRPLWSLSLLAAGIATAWATPTEQKAIVQAGTGGPEVLKYQTVPVLEPAAGQVLIKIYAASVNPVDWKARSGMVGGGRAPGGGEGAPVVSAATPENTRIPGSDAAGVIEKLGPGVTQFKVGDAVFASIGRGPATALNGGYSEYALASVGSVIAKPKSLTFAQASGLGTATSTGVRAVQQANIAAGQRVLIAGVAGGVGSAAAQAAKARGAYVIGTASAKHNAYLKSIGVDEVVDYTKVEWQNQIKNIDVVIDTVSVENATKAISTMKKGGTLVAIAGRLDAAVCSAAGVNCGAGQGGQGGGGPGGPGNAAPGGQAPGAGGPPVGGGQAGPNTVMSEIVKLVDAGKLTVNVDATFPLEKAGAAQEENRNGGTQGKIVLIINPAEANKK